MGLLDKAKGLIGKNADKVEDAIDKAADVADDKTGGQVLRARSTPAPTRPRTSSSGLGGDEEQ